MMNKRRLDTTLCLELSVQDVIGRHAIAVVAVRAVGRDGATHAAAVVQTLGGIPVHASRTARKRVSHMHEVFVLQRMKDLTVHLCPPQGVGTRGVLINAKAAALVRRRVELEGIKLLVEAPIGGLNPRCGKRCPGPQDVRHVGHKVVARTADSVTVGVNAQVLEIVRPARGAAGVLGVSHHPRRRVGEEIKTRTPTFRGGLNVGVPSTIVMHQVRPDVVPALDSTHGAGEDGGMNRCVRLADGPKVVFCHKADGHPNRRLDLLKGPASRAAHGLAKPERPYHHRDSRGPRAVAIGADHAVWAGKVRHVAMGGCIRGRVGWGGDEIPARGQGEPTADVVLVLGHQRVEDVVAQLSPPERVGLGPYIGAVVATPSEWSRVRENVVVEIVETPVECTKPRMCQRGSRARRHGTATQPPLVNLGNLFPDNVTRCR
eukprot:m.123476 g.123476  ORF g.123476 m.123476 type:complete len:431 (+) comp11129_c0_seq4:884-2176(+)